MRQFTSTFLLGMTAVGASLLTGCPDREISKVTPQQGRVEYKNIPVSLNRDLDLLFVIDDSGSMADKQQNLASNFRDFIGVLEQVQGGLPNVHIGVVTSDMGTSATVDGLAPTIAGTGGCSGTGKNGNLQVPMSANVSNMFISDIKLPDDTRMRNYTGDLATTFTTIAKVGDRGCGFEQHLEAMKRALDNNPVNAGFLRKDAFLAVVFIADEDDCSVSHKALLTPGSTSTMGELQSMRCTRFGVTCDLNGATPDQMNQAGIKGQCHSNESSQYLEKVGNYVSFLKSLKDDPNKIIVAGIVGVLEPFQIEIRSPAQGKPMIPMLAHSCTYAGATNPEYSDPPVRIKHFLDQFPGRSTYTSICQSNLADGLTLIANLIKGAIGDPCIEGDLADKNPSTPALDPDCSVSDVSYYGKENQSEKVLPACDNTTRPDMSTTIPCWHLELDPTNCSMTPTKLTLKVERGGQAAPPETHMVAYCVTNAD
jgi:hypothetical protein